MFAGSLVALVTPFKDGKLDEEGLRKNIRFQIENGTSGLVPCGTTGESPTLMEEEHRRVIEIAVEEAKGKIPVVAGAGTNSTDKTIGLADTAKGLGADGALVITPYYNKPTQEGLYQHFRAVAQAVDIPIVIYNVPGRTGVSIEPKTVARLAEFENIVAVKEASGNLNQVSDIVSRCGDRITVLSGDDSLTLPILSVGGRGVISVVANIVPKDLSDMIAAFDRGDSSEANRLHNKLFPLCRAMFIETNPIPVKTAMEMLGRGSDELRLPLAPMGDRNREKLEAALKDYGLMPD